MAMQKFPGFIDVHVHLRDPGAIEKEDFRTGTRAAVRGGFTFVIDMPNNPGSPTVSSARLNEKIGLATKKAVCDVGFHFGTDGKNLDTLPSVWDNSRVYGLKIYCGETTGELLVNGHRELEEIFNIWNSEKPVLVHAEGALLESCLSMAHRFGRMLHVCHMASREDLEQVRKAKKNHQYVTAGVTPHHLFLTDTDAKKLGPYGLVRPVIGSKKDQDALWEAVIDGTIDVVESDHAPHTKEEKGSSTPYFGVPGLETTVGLLFRAVKEGTLSQRHIVTLLHDNPKKIFSVADQNDTYIELDPGKQYRIGEGGYETKCGWSPFDGGVAYGKVQTVVLRGTLLVGDGKII